MELYVDFNLVYKKRGFGVLGFWGFGVLFIDVKADIWFTEC